MNNFWTKASENMPSENGEYIIVIGHGLYSYIELCNFSKEYNCFSCYDYYNDRLFSYKQEDISYWMKIPDYKILEK